MELRDVRVDRLSARAGLLPAIFLEDALLRKEGQGGMLDEPARQRVKEICELILKEQDQRRFSVLIAELNQLLDGLGPSGGEKASN